MVVMNSSTDGAALSAYIRNKSESIISILSDYGIDIAVKTSYNDFDNFVIETVNVYFNMVVSCAEECLTVNLGPNCEYKEQVTCVDGTVKDLSDNRFNDLFKHALELAMIDYNRANNMYIKLLNSI